MNRFSDQVCDFRNRGGDTSGKKDQKCVCVGGGGGHMPPFGEMLNII